MYIMWIISSIHFFLFWFFFENSSLLILVVILQFRFWLCESNLSFLTEVVVYIRYFSSYTLFVASFLVFCGLNKDKVFEYICSNVLFLPVISFGGIVLKG